MTHQEGGPEFPVPVVILAAGASSRLGRAKQLIQFRGRSLLSHAIATALSADCGPVVIVLGAGGDLLRDEAKLAGAWVVENPDWATGMGSSVGKGVGAVEAEFPGASAVLLTVCDQPLVTVEMLDAILRAHRVGRDLVASAYDGVVGVPALFSRRFFGELRELGGDSGARRVLARHEADVFALPFPDGALDVDTPTDLARLAEQEKLPRGER